MADHYAAGRNSGLAKQRSETGRGGQSEAVTNKHGQYPRRLRLKADNYQPFG